MEAPTIPIDDIKPGELAGKSSESEETASLTEESLYPDRAILTSTCTFVVVHLCDSRVDTEDC